MSSSSLRVYPEVRTSHVEEINATYPRPTLYRYLYQGTPEDILPADWQQVSWLGAILGVWRQAPESLELFEPGWLTTMWLSIALTYRLRRLGRSSRVSFFAIENATEGYIAPGWSAPLKRQLAKLHRLILREVVSGCIDRIVFGSEAADEAYTWLKRDNVDSVVIPQLRSPRGDVPEKIPASVCFIGNVSERKGIPQLMSAWEHVEEQLPGARLTIIGDGFLGPDVARWAEQRPDSRVFLGQLRHAEALAQLQPSSALVLPSQPWFGWREQIGESIPEALSVGSTIVTTTETGLASWLSAHGHTVIPTAQTSQQLGPALVTALSDPLDPAQVRADLPSTDGREAADGWLHRPAGDNEPDTRTPHRGPRISGW